jgi:hypothetical protein
MTQREGKLQYLLLFLILTLLLTVSELTAGQLSGARNAAAANFLNTKVAEFDLQNQTIVDGVWKLARAPEPFAFGFENVLKKKLGDPDVPDPRFSLQLQDKTVREVLDELCREYSRFTWSMDGTTVNVFPRVIINDASYLLNRNLERYDLKNATDVDKGLFAMARELPPPFEQIAHAQAGGGDPYPPEPWTVTYYNLTVRQVVNRLALHGGSCGIWIFGGAQDFRSFGFFNTYLHCYKVSVDQRPC